MTAFESLVSMSHETAQILLQDGAESNCYTTCDASGMAQLCHTSY